MTVYSNYLASLPAGAPLSYWPLGEASGTTATDVEGVNTATVNGSGAALGTGTSPGNANLDAKALVLDGVNDYLQLKNGMLLGNLTNFSLVMLLKSTATGPIYCERGTSGNNLIRLQLDSTHHPQLIWRGTTSTAQTISTSGSFTTVNNATTYRQIALVKTGSQIQMFRDGGAISNPTTLTDLGTWADSGIDARIGNDKIGATWLATSVCQVLVFTRALSLNELWENFCTAFPLQRIVSHRFPGRSPKVVQYQELPADVPLLSNSAAVASEFAALCTAQTTTMNYGTFTIPVFVSSQSDPQVAIRLSNNVTGDSDLRAAFAAGLGIPAVAEPSPGTDGSVSIYVPHQDRLFDIFAGGPYVNPPATVGASTSTASGTLAAGLYSYVVHTKTIGGGETGGIFSPQTTLSAPGTITVTWSVPNAAPGDVVGYTIYRRAGAPGTIFKLVQTINDPAITSWADDGGNAGTGSYTTTNMLSRTGDVNSSDGSWAAQYGGVQDDVSTTCRGHFDIPHQLWGQTATSIIPWAGTILLEEAVAASNGNEYAIGHSLDIIPPNFGQQVGAYVYPAQRSDGTGSGKLLKQGMRMQLDPTLDPTTAGFPTGTGGVGLARAIFRAYQRFGGFVRDSTTDVVVVATIEGPANTGRDYGAKMFGSKDFGSTGGSGQLLNGFPWSSMRVIDPQWTYDQSHALTRRPPRRLVQPR